MMMDDIYIYITLESIGNLGPRKEKQVAPLYNFLEAVLDWYGWKRKEKKANDISESLLQCFNQHSCSRNWSVEMQDFLLSK